MLKNFIRYFIFRLQNEYYKKYQALNALGNPAELQHFCDGNLQTLLLSAYDHVPYYRNIFDQIGILRNGAIDLSKFYKIPILTKETIRNKCRDLISSDHTKRKWFYNSSGGSTGEPVRFIQDDQYLAWRNATNYYYHKRFLGMNEPAAKKIILWGSEKDIFNGTIGLKAKTYNWLTNTIFFNSFRMSESDLARFVEKANTFEPELIRGYASSLYELSRYIERNGLRVHTPRIVSSSAEMLNGIMREKIESVFQTKLYDFYGSREVSNLAGECTEGLMHVFIFWNFVEILDSNGQPVEEGETGRVVATNLFNYSMPLIRYDIGDTAVLGPKTCKCGSILPTLTKIAGRMSDHFIKEDGAIIHGEYFTHLFYAKHWVKSFKAIQEDYKRVRILTVAAGDPIDAEKIDIEEKIKLVLGQDCAVIWKFVESIPETQSGKHLYTQSLIKT